MLSPSPFTATTAFVGSTPGFQPEIVPSSLTKINTAGNEFAPLVTLKNGVSLRTTPVGLPLLSFSRAGIDTMSERAVPSCLYRVETPVPLSLTQIVEPDEEGAMPQGLTRFGSVCVATPGMSDWKFVQL